MDTAAREPRRVLVVDLGGTWCRFAHFTVAANGGLRLEAVARLETAGLDSSRALLEALARADVGLAPQAAAAAVFAVPGAVVGRRVHFANIAWPLELDVLEAAFGPGRVACINDFAAQALGCLTEAAEAALEIRPGAFDAGKVRAVIGAGTGLGMAALVPLSGGGVMTLPSERGQSAMSFCDPTEQAFARCLCRQTGENYVRGDSALSGSGLARMHTFFTGERLSPAAVGEKLTPENRTTALFARLYGRAARDYALTVLADGGVYICGGVAAKNPLLVTHPEFTREFLDSPTYGDFLAAVPIRLVRNEDTGLFGAARHARTLLPPVS